MDKSMIDDAFFSPVPTGSDGARLDVAPWSDDGAGDMLMMKRLNLRSLGVEHTGLDWDT
jgi:hypothetical protein